MSTALVWFRRDLRLADNPALDRALRSHERVLPVYAHAPEEEAPWSPGAASRWWLHHSLGALDADLRRRGSALHVVRGASLECLRQLARATDAVAVYWNRCHEPSAIARDRAIKQALREDGLIAESCNGSLLCEPARIATAAGEPYRVFGPFWRRLRAGLQPRPPLPAPRRVASPALDGGLAPEELALRPHLAWADGFPAFWQPGEHGAARALRRFVDDALGDYAGARDRPAEAGTSRLSPHLHFGEVSPMQLVWAIEELRLAGVAADGAEAWLRELGWREFAQHLLFHYPHLPERNLDPRFDRFAWGADDPMALARWQRGRTGIPIVDAGMRELWHSGWMHNRVRMLVASLLTKNLRQHWLHGARWFWDTLVDADLANNAQGWQWSAGCGVDAAPYFRIFNPVSQGERFDPDGAYVRRWVPELADVAAPVVHRPWTDPAVLRRSGYPAPMLDLAETRADALAAWRALRAG